MDLAAGLFDLSRRPNEAALVRGFGEYEMVSEGEERAHAVGPGRQAEAAGLCQSRPHGRSITTRSPWRWPPTRFPTPRWCEARVTPGAALNLEQEISDDLGAFVRAQPE